MSQTKFSYLKGFVLFVVFIIVNFVLWRIFFAPTKGVFKLFTPMYGLSLIAVFYYCLKVVAEVFGFGPNEQSKTFRIVPLVTAVAVYFIVYYVFFWHFLGKYGVTYFSPYAIIDTGGTGAEMWNARENSSLAILYVATSFIFVTEVWDMGMGKFPWNNNSRATAGISKIFAVSTLSILIYAVLFHPNITALFVPKQVYAGVLPWWEDAAMTSSSFYHLGWIFSGMFFLILFNTSFDGKPLSYFKKDGQTGIVSGIAALIVTVVLGFIFMIAAESVMTYFWYEPFMGGNYTDDPRFRHLHVTEIAAFLILAQMIVNVYFNNVKNFSSNIATYFVRLLAVVFTGFLIYAFYYTSLGPVFMDRVPGVGNVDDTSLCWTIMSMTIIYVHEKYLNCYPLRG